MAGVHRTFSFNDNDEQSLSGNRGDYYSRQSPSPPAYTDSPIRQSQIPPPPPQHRNSPLPPIDTYTIHGQHLDHSESQRTTSTTTPGADNLGEAAAGGGIAGVAFGVAHTHARESGMEAVRSVENLNHLGTGIPQERGYDTLGSDTPYIPAPPSHRNSRGMDPFISPSPSRQSNPFDDARRGSLPPSQGSLTPRGHQSSQSIPLNDYTPREGYAYSRGSSYLDNPYNRFSSAWDPMVARGDIDPHAIDDDGDDGIEPHHANVRSNTPGASSLGNRSIGQKAAAGGMLGAISGVFGSKNIPGGTRDTSGNYGPVGYPVADNNGATEKSEWLNRQTSGRKRLRWIVGIIIVLVVIAAVVGGVIAGLHRSGSSTKDVSSSSGSASSQSDSSNDLDKNSPEIKKLMNNAALHKVFPGVDYTPFNAQYPDCLSNPPSQNNVTKDVAVLSQLTNTIRLYGTDCNQTEMVLHALDKLSITDMKVWLGVWLDDNSTTVDRGMSAMYDILSKNGQDPFAGVIIGNEVLFRKDMTVTQLGDLLSGVKKNLTAQKIDLPVATSDLGNDWTADLAQNVDVIMSNIHPFFAGVTADVASGWTWNFWQEKDVSIVTQGMTQKNVISEVGWPSDGGTDCGPDATTCTPGVGSVAGINEMNTFMEDFVCQSLANGTNYFW